MAPLELYGPPSLLDLAKATQQISNNSTSQPINGWVQQPDNRGTWDIVQTCVITVVLCSWTSLCLNIHPRKGRWFMVRNKLRWMFFTIFWPEVTTGSALEQWESACQSVEDFKAAGHPNWTMRHAFLANMGGFLLYSPDFPPFPIDSQQLLYLVKKNIVQYPEDIDSEYIWDKNKADGFSRTITMVQVAWFTIQCIGRAIQHLTLTTLELLTLTFIYCTLATTFFWSHKPLDIQTPIPLRTNTRIADILIEAGEVAKSPYDLTPLDFLVPAPSKGNFIATWWWGCQLCFDGIFFEINEKVRPVTTFANSRTRPPRDSRTLAVTVSVMLATGYFALHFAGWNFRLPTAIEVKLWHAAILWMGSEWTLYLIVFNIVSASSNFLGMKLFKTPANSFIEMAELFPRWFQLTCLIPVYGSYGLARVYIIVEGFISLRSLPAEAYLTINWYNFIPHF